VRTYLVHKKVWPKRYSEPEEARREDVTSFEDDHVNGPSLSVPLVDWKRPLSSAWNRELTFLLAQEVRPRLLAAAADSSFTHDMTALSYIQWTIEQKLERWRFILKKRNRAAPSVETADQKAKRSRLELVAASKASRRRSRRNGVSLSFHRLPMLIAIPLDLQTP
jgi:hypothetical protein